jgi:oligoribonuclease
MLAIFLDMETTGLDPQKHRAIDLAFKIVNLSLGSLVKEFQCLIRQPQEAWDLRDPFSITINGYTWDEVSKGEDPITLGRQIVNTFTEAGIQRGKAIFICQNPGFDRAFFSQLVDVYTQESLNWPYHWLDLASMYWSYLSKQYIDRQIPFPESVNLSKNEIAKAFQLSEEQNPHRAINGVNHLIQCYQAVLGEKFQY